MNLRIDGKIITSLTNDELGATLQQIADEINRRDLPEMDLAFLGIMGASRIVRGVKER